MCLCDMFPDPHPAGHTADGITCELALPGARISPHLVNALTTCGLADGEPPTVSNHQRTPAA